MTQLAEALAGLVRVLRVLPVEQQQDVIPALTLLSESLLTSLSEDRPVAAPGPDSRLQRLAALEIQLQDHDPGQRSAIIRERMGGLSKSVYYRLRAAAIDAGLVPP